MKPEEIIQTKERLLPIFGSEANLDEAVSKVKSLLHDYRLDLRTAAAYEFWEYVMDLVHLEKREHRVP